MATKSITITEDAYEYLAADKKENESFSDVLIRTFKKSSLGELIGILTKEEANDMKRHIAERRKSSRARSDALAARFT